MSSFRMPPPPRRDFEPSATYACRLLSSLFGRHCVIQHRHPYDAPPFLGRIPRRRVKGAAKIYVSHGVGAR